MIGYATLYVLVGALSFATASVASNTAAVWLPTGFSLALLLARGQMLWPAVAVGAFILNLGDNLIFAAVPVPVAVAVAAAVAAGNTAEALVGAALTHRYAGGAALLSRPIHVAAFAALVAALVATLPPLVSMGVGVAASRLGSMLPSAALREAMLTWYLANAVGILIVAAPCLALFTVLGSGRAIILPPVRRGTEATVLVASLVVVSQSMDGLMLMPTLAAWPRSYMLIPLLLWAAFRFRTAGALAAILLVTAVSVIGTMRGFEAFPAGTPSRSLLYLQLFLGMLAVTTLAITAALAEIDALQAGLETALRDRTVEVERLVRARDLFSSLVVHDLQSPIYSVRNALRATATAIEASTLPPEDVASALRVMDETCCDLAARMAGLLRAQALDIAPQVVSLHALLQRIAAARGLRVEDDFSHADCADDAQSLSGRSACHLLLRFDAADITVRRPAEVERILDGLIGNAARHGPGGGTIEVCAYRHGGDLVILVSDEGDGVEPASLTILFRSEMLSQRGASTTGTGGYGLYLAGEQAAELGGRLSYISNTGRSTFKLVVPV